MHEHWQSRVDLRQRNTLAAPCCAEFFSVVDTEAKLHRCVKAAKGQKLALHVLGGGSNVLCPEWLAGVVISPAMRGISIERGQGHALLKVAAGENWHDLVKYCLSQKLYGIENLALIPGLVGAAPIQNIGAYGVELADVLESVRYFDLQTQVFATLSRSQCALAYRDSIFKRALRGRAVVTEITLKLSLTPKPNYEYGPLANALGGLAPTPENIFKTVCALRSEKLPDPADIPNAGSFFKNPIVLEDDILRLKKDYPSLPYFDASRGRYKIPAAWLIDQAGLKGQKVGRLQVHTHQALVLTNPAGCALTDILQASELIACTVKARFNVELEREPQILGDSA